MACGFLLPLGRIEGDDLELFTYYDYLTLDLSSKPSDSVNMILSKEDQQSNKNKDNRCR
jgi:hypothetical protein